MAESHSELQLEKKQQAVERTGCTYAHKDIAAFSTCVRVCVCASVRLQLKTTILFSV